MVSSMQFQRKCSLALAASARYHSLKSVGATSSLLLATSGGAMCNAFGVVAGNREAVTLGGLTPDTQYQLTVAAVWNGKKYRSRPIVFRTLEPPRTSSQPDSGSLVGGSGPPNSPHADTAPSLSGIGIFNDEFGNISVNSTSRELPTHPGADAAATVPTAITATAADTEPLNAQPHHSHPHLAGARHHVEPASSHSPPAHERRHSMVPHGSLQHGSRQPLLGPGAGAPGTVGNHRHVHPLLQRHRSEDRPLLRHTHHGRQGSSGCQRHLTKPLLQRPPLTHAHSVQQPPAATTMTPRHHAPHHHHSHPRLSQKHRQKLFSRSKQYTSVCSGGSNSTNYAADSGGTRSRSSREHADDDVEACRVGENENQATQKPPPPYAFLSTGACFFVLLSPKQLFGLRFASICR
uniref:Fibronectin type-III domain-containing protein n=1 Tax=Anopheles farauti TaxID=69004 RepID=A0A182QJQ1_9DIPT